MNSRLLITNIIGFIVVAALIILGIYFYYQNENYVKTDDAVVSADMTQIVAPSSGLLTTWNLKEGKDLSKNDSAGTVTGAKSSTDIKARMAGKVIKNNVKANQMVQAGQVLAQEADMDHLYIIANIKENKLKDIKKGNSVDVTVDGDPGTTFDGTVEEIGYATNSVFSVLPSQSSTGNYTKVTQTVPVKIALNQASDKVLPGMNAEVKISQ